MVGKPKNERVFSLSITAKDIAIMVVSSCFGIVLLGILVTHDIAFGIIVALFSIAWTLTTRCLTYNPNKYLESKEEEEDLYEEPISGHDALLHFVINLLTLSLGMLMIGRSSLLWVSADGEHHEILNFIESNHIETAGWLLVTTSLFFIIRPVFLWIRSKVWRK